MSWFYFYEQTLAAEVEEEKDDEQEEEEEEEEVKESREGVKTVTQDLVQDILQAAVGETHCVAICNWP